MQKEKVQSFISVLILFWYIAKKLIMDIVCIEYGICINNY